ncbi:MAG: methyltransferase [Alphaproteobacteria bacterium]|nr:methyltransferase [Alphaproteobacteria bacterium]
MNETLDNFLGGRIKLVQPSEGYRAGIDPIFLAASIHPKSQDCILDVGSGGGISCISLAVRCPTAQIIGLEVQPNLVEMAQTNIRENNLEDRVKILKGDLKSPPPLIAKNSFDHVMTNPPYFEEKRVKISPVLGRAQANTETVDLGTWIKCCLKFLKPKGIFTMIHRTERLSEICAHLGTKVGDLVIYPLWPTANKPARRVIIQGRKNTGGEPRLARGLILHGEMEKYTPEAEAVLRHAESIVL